MPQMPLGRMGPQHLGDPLVPSGAVLDGKEELLQKMQQLKQGGGEP